MSKRNLSWPQAENEIRAVIDKLNDVLARLPVNEPVGKHEVHREDFGRDVIDAQQSARQAWNKANILRTAIEKEMQLRGERPGL